MRGRTSPQTKLQIVDHTPQALDEAHELKANETSQTGHSEGANPQTNASVVKVKPAAESQAADSPGSTA